MGHVTTPSETTASNGEARRSGPPSPDCRHGGTVRDNGPVIVIMVKIPGRARGDQTAAASACNAASGDHRLELPAQLLVRQPVAPRVAVALLRTAADRSGSVAVWAGHRGWTRTFVGASGVPRRQDPHPRRPRRQTLRVAKARPRPAGPRASDGGDRRRRLASEPEACKPAQGQSTSWAAILGRSLRPPPASLAAHKHAFRSNRRPTRQPPVRVAQRGTVKEPSTADDTPGETTSRPATHRRPAHRGQAAPHMLRRDTERAAKSSSDHPSSWRLRRRLQDPRSATVRSRAMNQCLRNRGEGSGTADARFRVRSWRR
jgi:hypothetical protein